MSYQFEIEELGAWHYKDHYFIDLLNGELTLEEAQENLASFRGSQWYTGTKKEYMPKEEQSARGKEEKI